MNLAILLHLAFALGAVVLGPFALWARKGSPQHRAAGYLWVALMLAAAVSSLFIRDYRGPNLAGFAPLHLLALATFAGVGGGIAAVMTGRIALHRRVMQRTYLGACIGAGFFALMPQRLLGQLLWHTTLGLV